ncbi:hypothetical protein IT418_01615 [bacterium]|nr:hypothetical protein [bacterium]
MEENRFRNMQKYLEIHAQNVLNARQKKFDVTLDEQKAKILELINQDNFDLPELKKELKLLYEIAIQGDEYMLPENMLLFVGTFCEQGPTSLFEMQPGLTNLLDDINSVSLAIVLGTISYQL